MEGRPSSKRRICRIADLAPASLLSNGYSEIPEIATGKFPAVPTDSSARHGPQFCDEVVYFDKSGGPDSATGVAQGPYVGTKGADQADLWASFL